MLFDIEMPTSGIGATEEHAQLILESYKKWTGKNLIVLNDEETLSEQLFFHPKIILSHGVEEDPTLNFGNIAALQLWEMDWETFTSTPSRLTAEEAERSKREQFMKKIAGEGYAEDYTGIRISSTGLRFYINDAIVWNLIDQNGHYAGQAAAFSSYKFV